MAGKPGRPRKERSSGDDENDKIWGVRGVDEATRKRVKVYALLHDLSVGEALTEMIELSKLGEEARGYERQTGMPLREIFLRYVFKGEPPEWFDKRPDNIQVAFPPKPEKPEE